VCSSTSTSAKYEHIPDADHEPLRKQIAEAAAWLAQQEAALAAAPKTQSPPVNVEDAKKKSTALSKLAHDVMGKAKPAPPKEEKKPAAAAADGKPEEAKKSADAKKPDEGVKEKDTKPAHTQMDVDA